MSLIGRVLREERVRRQNEVRQAADRPPMKTVWVDVPLPEVRAGDFALRIDRELDPRPVAEVDHDRDMVRLDILGSVTPPIPLEYYTYRRPTQVPA